MMQRFVLYELDLKKLRAAEIEMWRGASRDTTATVSDLLNAIGNANHVTPVEDVAPWSYIGDRFIKNGVEYEPSSFTAAGAVLAAVIKLPKIPFGIYPLSYTTRTENLITFTSLWCIAEVGDGATTHVPFCIHAAMSYDELKDVGRIEDYFRSRDEQDRESSLLENALAPSSLRLQRTIAAYRNVLDKNPEWASAFALELINHHREVDSEIVTMMLALPPSTSTLVLALRGESRAKTVESHRLALGRSIQQRVGIGVAIVALLAILATWVATR
jgi:hypothetical protein